jgi:hypothetical protein
VRFEELGMPSAAWNIALAWRRDESEAPLVRRFVETVGKGTRAGRARPAGQRPGGPARL